MNAARSRRFAQAMGRERGTDAVDIGPLARNPMPATQVSVPCLF